MNLSHINCNRPYLNRFVKLKQQQIEDSYHSTNLKQIKPINTKMMQHAEIRFINNRKTEMIKELKEIQIQRENKLLLKKLSSVMSNYGAYSVYKTKKSHTKVSKSLNDIYRKKQTDNIQYQNKRFLLRLQNKRATLDLSKLNKDWSDNQKVIRRMAKGEFHLTNLRSTANSRNRQRSTSDSFYRNKWERFKMSKRRNIDGYEMLIKIEFVDGVLKIVGDAEDNKDLKVIEIPKQEAIVFIQKDCHGQIELLFQKLKYDSSSETLYLVSENMQQFEVDFGGFNPELVQVPRNVKNFRRGYYKEGQRDANKQSDKLQTQKKQKQSNNVDIFISPAVKPKTAENTKSPRENSHNSISKSLLSVEPAVDTKDPRENVFTARDQQDAVVQMEQKGQDKFNAQEALKKKAENSNVYENQEFVQQLNQQKNTLMQSQEAENRV